MRKPTRTRVTRQVEIAGAPDRPAAEALYLELRRLAERHGVTLRALRIVPLRGGPAGGREPGAVP